MNEDKELEEAIAKLQDVKEFWINYNYATEEGKKSLIENAKAIETVLQVLKNNKNKEKEAMEILKKNSIGRYKNEKNGEISHIIAVEDFKRILNLIERQEEQLKNSIPKKKIEDKIKDIEKFRLNKKDYYKNDYFINCEIRLLQELLEDK